MQGTRLVRRKTLEKLFNVNYSTLYNWDKTGLLTCVYVADEKHYDSVTVDTFLAHRPHNFETPPTLNDLLSGVVTLINTEDTMERLDRGFYCLRYRMRVGRLLGIQLGNAWRFSQESVEACRRVDISNEQLSRKVAARVTATSQRTIQQFVSEGRLVIPEVNLQNRLITRDSLLKLLSELLPEWIDPQDWLEDRLSDERPLVSVATALIQLGIHRKELQSLLATKRLRYINSPRGHTISVAPDAIDAYVEYSQSLSPEEIGRLFGVSRSAVRDWIKKEMLICPIATHDHTTQRQHFYRSCLVAILRLQLTPGIQPILWYHTRLEHGGKLVECHDAAPIIGLPYHTVQQLAETGQIRGIKTPTNRWMFTTEQLARMKRQQRAAR